MGTGEVRIKGPSKAWYLLPILFGIIGGFIMYYVLKDENRQMAKRGLMLSVILTIIGIAIYVVVFAAAVASIPR